MWMWRLSLALECRVAMHEHRGRKCEVRGMCSRQLLLDGAVGRRSRHNEYEYSPVTHCDCGDAEGTNYNGYMKMKG
eukprot:scaffold42145_cov39-Tisochrysis_lutea.AAC.1